MIPLRPLGRILAQFVFVVSGSVLKATYNAYKQSLQNGNLKALVNSKIMSKEEAAKVLGFNSHENLKISQIQEAQKRLKRINEPSGGFQGSPYLVQRIEAAGFVLGKYYQGKRENL